MINCFDYTSWYVRNLAQWVMMLCCAFAFISNDFRTFFKLKISHFNTDVSSFHGIRCSSNTENENKVSIIVEIILLLFCFLRFQFSKHTQSRMRERLIDFVAESFFYSSGWWIRRTVCLRPSVCLGRGRIAVSCWLLLHLTQNVIQNKCTFGRFSLHQIHLHGK